MIRRIFIVALFTGAGQIFIIFSLKYLSQNHPAGLLKEIAQIDSLVLFLINMIALGLQPATMRNLALEENWQDGYRKTQSARLALSLPVTLLAALAITDKFYLAFLIAPLLALNGDYALYGRGYPVKGSLVAMGRSIIPFLAVLVFSFYRYEDLAWIYLGGLVLAYLITNLSISAFLKVTLFPVPRLKDISMYLKTLLLGIVSLGLYFIGMGVILVAQYFYPDPALATAFVGLKFYIIFKGVLRIIHQAFLKDMIREEIWLKVDQLSSLLGLTFFAFMMIFPETFISTFFGKNYLPGRQYFIYTALAALVYSLFSGFTTRAMLEKRDRPYALVTTIAALVSLGSCVILSFRSAVPESIGISVLAGELVFAAGMIRLMKRRKYLAERLYFLLINSGIILVPLAARLVAGDQDIGFFTALIASGGFLFLINRKKFRLAD